MIGQTVSHYRILSKLGEGGMGVVYKAEDTKLHRQVALKFLPSELTSDPNLKERFIHEAQAASTLDHPNICTVYEVNETEDGSSFIAMACYDGETLKAKINRGPLKIEQATDIALQVAHGLARSHEAGIIHRDIKPANIMITSDGIVKILDFGLAKLLYETKITQTGSTLGTVAYMSPEQLKGEKVDRRSDIWSLGVVLYEMLTGQIPFKGEHPLAVSYSIVNEIPEQIFRHRKGIPAKLENLINQCLQKNKELRPQSAHDVIKILEEKSTRIRTHLSKRILIVGGLIVIAGLVSLYLNFYPPRIDLPKEKELGIAVMNFTVLNDSSISRWPGILQTIIIGELTGIEHIAVSDPWSLDGLIKSTFGGISSPRSDQLNATLRDIGVTMFVNGQIVNMQSEYIVYANLIDVDSSKVVVAMKKSIKEEVEIPQVAEYIVREILDYHNIQSEDRYAGDLEPWRQGAHNLEAVKAFETASRYIYLVESGGEPYLLRALDLDSTFISPRVWLISSLGLTGRRDEALKHYDTLLQLKPYANHFENAMIEWSDAYLKNDKKFQEQALERALKYSKSNNILLANLAEIRYESGDYQAALDALLPIVKMRWHYAPVYALAARCYIKLGNLKDAHKLLIGSLNIPKPSGSTYSLLAALSLRDGDTSQADYYTSKALNAYNETSYPWEKINEYIGSDFLTVECWNEAIVYFRKALVRNPELASVHQGLGDALNGMGKWKNALEEYHRALNMDSTLNEAHFSIAQISDERGMIKDAVDHYRLFLTSDSISKNAMHAKKREESLRSALRSNTPK